MIRILGIDPGSHITGYGVIELHGNRILCVGCGSIKTRGESLAERLQNIYHGIDEVVTEYQPHEAAIENVFVHRNVDSALKLGQARGAAITAVALRRLPVNEYSPMEIKKAVVGRGNATKVQVQHMVKALLALAQQQPADTSDALAVAICHSHSRGQLRKLGKLATTRRSRWRLKATS